MFTHTIESSAEADSYEKSSLQNGFSVETVFLKKFFTLVKYLLKNILKNFTEKLLKY